MAYATTNPYTGQRLQVFPDATDSEVDAALDRADASFQQWKNTSIAQRVAVLANAARLLRARHGEYAKLLTLEMGKLYAEAEAEVEISAAILEYYVDNAEKLLAPEPLASKDAAVTQAWLIHDPLGIILAIEPWNFPYYQIARILAPQLAAGNVVVLKHASNVPQCAALFEKLMLESGLPAGAFKNLYATRTQIERIINDPRVHGVALTGSEEAGALVAAQAGKALKKSTMELGGADAFVVLADADIDKAVRWAVFGRHWNAGQVCCSSKRIIVVEAIYNEFIRRYAAGVAKLKAGDPMDPATTLAPLSSQSAADELRKKIAQAVARWRHAHRDRSRGAEAGRFRAPGDADRHHERQPGLLSGTLRPGIDDFSMAKDEDEAIADRQRFALRHSADRCLRRTSHTAWKWRGASPPEWFTSTTRRRFKADLPFGGVRRSGYGRELIGLGLKEFVNHKLIGVTDIDGPF